MKRLECRTSCPWPDTMFKLDMLCLGIVKVGSSLYLTESYIRTSLLPSVDSRMLSERAGEAVTTRPGGFGDGVCDAGGAGGAAGAGGQLVVKCCEMEWLLSPWAVL